MAAIRISNSALCLALGAVLGWAAPLDAQERTDPHEAARHFDRGYLLAQQGSLEAAIAEFKQAYALSPHPSVLYNLGQAYAASGRAVEAVQTLRKYLEQADAKLDAERRAQAAAVVDYQGQRIGTLELEIEPAGAELMIDGETIGKAPLSSPVQLTAGLHGLTVAYAGYTPRSVRIEIVGKTAASAQVRLEPSGALTRLTVTCSVPDVTVSGEGIPSTRLERGGQLMVATPPAELRFERAGFVAATRPVPPDTAQAIDCGIGALDQRAKLMPVAVEAPPAVAVNVDGQRFRQGKLPLGRHFVALSGAGIEHSEQLIEIGPQRGKLSVDAREPGAAMVAERSSRRRLQLTLAIVTSAAGVVSLGAAGALYAVNQSAYAEWRDDGGELATRMSSSPSSVSAGDWNRLLERENALRNRDAAALGLTVFGGLLISSGAVLWLTAPHPATSGVTLRIGKSSWVGYSAPF
jgi:tetratricopeptide (TPR) repeat protein